LIPSHGGELRIIRGGEREMRNRGYGNGGLEKGDMKSKIRECGKGGYEIENTGMGDWKKEI
jgi:hypothetical protein